MPTCRESLLDCLSALGSQGSQLEYQKSVPIAYVPSELASQFFDDIFHPKSPQFISEFSEEELKDVAVFAGFLHIASKQVEGAGSPPLQEVLKLTRWREMMDQAKLTCERLKRNG